jgi:hypothetical protein
MLVGSILPTSGNVRLDLMDLLVDLRQFGETSVIFRKRTFVPRHDKRQHRADAR